MVIAGNVSHSIIASGLYNNVVEFYTRYELHNSCDYYSSDIHKNTLI